MKCLQKKWLVVDCYHTSICKPEFVKKPCMSHDYDKILQNLNHFKFFVLNCFCRQQLKKYKIHAVMFHTENRNSLLDMLTCMPVRTYVMHTK